MEEYLDIVDINGIPTGRTVARSVAHAEGIRHRTSHVWILRRVGDKVQILLQMRCKTKDAYPGCFDISSAGHIPAGIDFKDSAIRELREELGIDVSASDLIEVGYRNIDCNEVFHGKPFVDRQYSKIFVLWLDRDENDFTVQKEEIDFVKWFDFEECYANVISNSFSHCILTEELDIVSRAFTE
ncbi:MAG: NUDIX domain-containing protein [Clostridia bacterium]|nr:NUDIX domain-containing protein [Clostridia bacterium]